MPFKHYLKSHYSAACTLQRDIANDPEMVSALRERSATQELVEGWMRGYGLFQGITSAERSAVAASFLQHARTLRGQRRPLTTKATSARFTDLFVLLHGTVERSWISATSKLLWCVYPEDFVIYDAFVHRALVVLQRLEPDLQDLDRIGAPPKIESHRDIDQAVAYYMRYQAMVKRLLERNQPTLDALREKYGETYPYDIRIVDKLLWMIGSPSTKY